MKKLNEYVVGCEVRDYDEFTVTARNKKEAKKKVEKIIKEEYSYDNMEISYVEKLKEEK